MIYRELDWALLPMRQPLGHVLCGGFQMQGMGRHEAQPSIIVSIHTNKAGPLNEAMKRQ